MKPENVARRGARACWARTSTSPSSGSASTASSRGACSASGTAACCSPATPRIRCRRSARAAATAACRTPTISCGSSTSCCAGWRPSGCSTATTRSASWPPTRTCSTPPARPTSSRPKSAISRMFRDGVLALAETEPFARRLVNSGRLSTASCYDGSPLNGAGRFCRGRVRWRCVPGPRRSMPHSTAAGCCIASARASPAFAFSAGGRIPEDFARARAAPCAKCHARQPGRRCFTVRRFAPATAPSAIQPTTSSAPTGMWPHVGDIWQRAPLEAALDRATAAIS